MLADRGQRILQGPPLGGMVEHVAGRQQLEPRLVGDPRQAREAACIVAAIKVLRGDIGAPWEIGRDPEGALAMRGEA